MLGVREHIDRLDGGDLVLVGEKCEVTGLGGRVAAYIDHTGRGGLKDYLGDIRMDAGARRIQNDHIRLPMLLYEITAQDILMSPAKNSQFVMPFPAAFTFASSIASGTYSMPTTLAALPETN